MILSPVSVPAGGHIPLNVLVNTAGQFGRYQHSVAVRCRDSSGLDSTTTADIELHVAGALYAFPNPVFIDDADPGQPISKDVDLYDASPGSGIEIVEVSSSDSSNVRVEVLTDFERHVISEFDPGGSHNSRADFKHRHRLRVTITPPNMEDAWLRDSVVIKTAREKAPPVVVPISVRTKQPAWKLRPDALLITLGAGQLRAARKVRCYLDRSKVVGELVVLDCPAGPAHQNRPEIEHFQAQDALFLWKMRCVRANTLKNRPKTAPF